MKAPLLVLSVLTIAPVPVRAQAREGNPAANPAVNTARILWEQLTGHITTAAEDLPDSTYSYRPTAAVRSFGQIIGHVAGARYHICAAALGGPAREEDEIERSRAAKGELLAALKASTEYCARAYAQTDQAAQQRTKLVGQERTRLFALGFNATHNAEHYGNIVTYLRLNGMVPPTSRRGS